MLPATTMNITRTLMAAAVIGGAPFLISNLQRGEKISFAVAEGSSVTKSFTTSITSSLDDMQMLMNGEENAMMPSIEMDMEVTSTVKVTDTYGAIADGRPSKLSRKFEEIGMGIDMEMAIEMMGDTQDEAMEGSGESELEGKTVEFTWDKDAGEYVVQFAEDENGDKELLEGLTEDMSLRGLLPKSEVAEGDTWEIDMANLVIIMAPGGDLGLEVDMDDEAGMMGGGPDPEMMSDFSALLGGEIDGEFTGKLMSVREVDGNRIAVIEIVVEIDTKADLIDMALEQMDQEELPEGMEMDVTMMDVEFAYEAKGELLWNLTKGHVAGFELKGETAMAMEMAMEMSGMMEMTMEMSMEMSGELGYSITVE